MNVVKKSITEIIDTGYRAFAMYTLEARALPSVIDGFKPVHRKLVYAMLTDYSGKKVKMADLGGISKFNYHHGEASAIASAINLASPWSNNTPVFDGHGNFGSRLVQEAAGARYIYATLSKVFNKIFIDEEVAPKAFDEENPEPAFYLPIIPWILVNGVEGMAVGFRTAILPRSVSDLTVAVTKYLKNPAKFLADNEAIAPTFPSFKGSVIKLADSQWKTQGLVEYAGKNCYRISELPIGYDREKYVIFLNSLLDKDLIKDYDDECSKDGFGFKVKVSLAQREVIDKDPFKYFSLEKTHTEILTTLGIDGKLKIFESVAQLIAYFVDYRTTKFREKIDFDIAKQQYDLEVYRDKIKFIDAVNSNKIDFRKTTKQELLDFIFTSITEKDHGKKFIHIPLYECTSDAISFLEEKQKEGELELKRLQSLDEKIIFSEKLASIKKL